MKNTTEKVQHSIQMYSILSVIIVAIIISFVAIYPLYSKLRDTEKRGLIFARDTSALIVEEYLSRIKDISRQISSRTKARLLLREYQRGEIKKEYMEKFLRTILEGALKSSTQLVSIRRFDEKQQTVISVGKPIPVNFIPKNLEPSTLKMYGPFIRNKHYFITISSPIYSPKNELIGNDITIFNITDLKLSIHQKMQNRLGEILIASINQSEVNVFSPLATHWRKLLEKQNILSETLIKAVNHKEHGLLSGKIGKHSIFVAYAPVHQSHWGIAVIIKKSTLYASIKEILWDILAMIIFVVLLFVIGLSFILKPLSGRVILYERELEKQVKESQSALEKANEQLQHLVIHDSLTDIMNRRGFNEAFKSESSRAKRYHQTFTLFYIDINDFKKINDEKGHEVGDQLLKEFSERLQLTMRGEDTVARLGGDEFAILVTNLGKDKINIVMKKIKEIAKLPISFKDELLNFSVSIGAATFPNDGVTLNNLLHKADQSMYKEKKLKKKD